MDPPFFLSQSGSVWGEHHETEKEVELRGKRSSPEISEKFNEMFRIPAYVRTYGDFDFSTDDSASRYQDCHSIKFKPTCRRVKGSQIALLTGLMVIQEKSL